ncbi:putative non-specific serine/threonine protein kinase [Rosa chinensis]|uniref:Putative non-specific serine/threonine protein kinase n=1 Tax=Rosa chinensis TaxID=74649 RepID=A0A2P6QN52_ROSCH|nr:putative non-specific serine/threonine protein kinase [Rosa chinensis]
MLGFNQLSGEFPKELCTLPKLVSGQAAAQVGRFFLELPMYYQPAEPSADAVTRQYNYLFFIPVIYLSHNCPSGNIPIEIGQLQLLQLLDLSANNFSGNIPDQISNLKYMEVLDLSMNHLSGKIPASITGLNFLSSFNVSHNNLGGPIPSSTQLQSFNASAFEGNLKLCGALLPNKCQTTEGSDAPDMSTQDADTRSNKGLHFQALYRCNILFSIKGRPHFTQKKKKKTIAIIMYHYIIYVDSPSCMEMDDGGFMIK